MKGLFFNAAKSTSQKVMGTKRSVCLALAPARI